MKKQIFYLFIFWGLFHTNAQNKAMDIAVQARDVYAQAMGEIKTPLQVFDWDKGKNLAVNFKNGGYVLLQKNGANYIVTGIIPNYRFSLSNNQLIQDKGDVKINDIDEAQLPPAQAPASSKSPANDVSNFMTNEWGSVNCIDDQNNIVNVTNYYTPGNCSAGCVAISTSQILHYYKWPIVGVGNNTYSDNYSGSLVRHGAFFDAHHYAWNDMLDQYMYVGSTEEQREAVGRLVYDVAVAVEMNFEPDGSSSNVNNVPFILENYFRYTGHYENRSWSSFWNRLYQNMQNRMPVSLAVENSAGEGHAIVISGYKTVNGDPYYYINWGWWNSGTPHNGWYYLQSWNSSTSGYNNVIGGLFDVLPEPEITAITPTGNGNDFTVHWETAQNVNWEEFTLQQKVDGGAWETVASGITSQDYTIQNPSGNMYIFRVKGKANGGYYYASYSEQIPYAAQGGYDGYVAFEGQQYAYAKQTPDYDLIFNHDYTFETWIRLKPGNQNGDVIFDREYIFAMEIDDVTSGNYNVVFKSPATNDELRSDANGVKLQLNQWYHIAVSMQDQTARLFVNGEQRDMDTNNHFHLNSSNTAINIGERYHGSYSGFIIADFDQIRFSDSARYTGDFTPPTLYEYLGVDEHTKGYFIFENIHRNRLKDEAHRVSVRVSNASGYVVWKYDYDANATGINEQEIFAGNIQVYPNPVSDWVHIKATEKFPLKDYQFHLFDLNGREIPIEFQQNNQQIDIYLGNLSKGSYILTAGKENFKASTTLIKL